MVVLSNARTRGAKGLCLEVHDLAISKLVAWREKDKSFLHALVRYGLVNRATLEERLAQTVLDETRRKLIESFIATAFALGQA